jgi:hypothetical protein
MHVCFLVETGEVSFQKYIRRGRSKYSWRTLLIRKSIPEIEKNLENLKIIVENRQKRYFLPLSLSRRQFYIGKKAKIGKKGEATTQYFIYSGDKAYTVKKS